MYLTIIILIFFSLNLNAETTFWGKAYDEHNQVIYFENHYLNLDKAFRPIRTTTLYYTNTGKFMAELKSDYTKSLLIPTYTFKDETNNYKEGVEAGDNDKQYIFYHYPVREKKKTIIKKDEQNGLFAGQSWHYYFQTHLGRPEELKGQVINLILPKELKSYPFKINSVEVEGDIVQIEMDLDHFILQFFAPSFDLTYQKSNKRLIKYVGPSNIPDEKGDIQKVKIIYNYDRPFPF